MNVVVHVVDDDSEFRWQVSEILSSANYHVVNSDSAQSFIKVFEPTVRGCALIDERMPGKSGIETLGEISKWLKVYPVILITAFADIPMTVNAMRCGAFDVLEKPCSLEKLLAKVQEAVKWNETVWGSYSESALAWSNLQKLTLREREVLNLIIEGQSSKTIGHRLNISSRTVDNHRVHILEKMNAKSLSDLGRSVASAEALFDNKKFRC